MAKKQVVRVKVNGREHEALVEPRLLLVHFIREVLGLTGTHVGCDTSHCGACTVVLDGKTVKSCTMFTPQADGSEILTVEGLIKNAQLHPLQEGFKEEHGLQCGFCTPGMLMSSYVLLQNNKAHRGGNPLGNLRQSLPLHRLSEHREGGAVRGRQDGGTRSKVMLRTSPEIGGMGHSIKRKEDLRFIMGKGNYVDDVRLPDMVYGQMVRSPYAHARLKSINTEKAKALPGVLAVITGEDLAKANLAWMPTLFFDKQMVLATGKVLFQSQEVAFVVAEDRYIAADAAELVEVEYEELPVLVDPHKATDPGSPILRDDREEKSNHIFHWEVGDKSATDKAFQHAQSRPIFTPCFNAAIRRRSRPAAVSPTSTGPPAGSPST